MGLLTHWVCNEQTRVGPKNYAKDRETIHQTNRFECWFLSQMKEKSITTPLEAQSQRIHSPYILGLSPRM